MAVAIPAQYSYKRYFGGMDLSREFLAKPSFGRWRNDSDTRLPGGARRTYSPYDRLVDWPKFGGSKTFRDVMHMCIEGANQLMSDVLPEGIAANEPWHGNRVVINRMPAGQALTEHADPLHFMGGVVVIGFGEADFIYRTAGDGSDEATLHNDAKSLMIVPPKVRHRVVNGNAPRISVVVAHDVQLAEVGSLVGQALASRVASLDGPA